MKQFKSFAVALAALTMFSCSKENIETPENKKGEPATINLKIVGNETSSKAAGAPGDATDVVITDGVIFLFKTDGTLDSSPIEFTGTSKQITTATTASAKVYVVANIGPFASSPLKDVRTEWALLAATGDLFAAATEDAASTQTSTKLWMSGSSAIDFAGGTVATPSVTLSFVSARLDVIIKDKRTNNTAGAGKISIVDENVALLFAGSKGLFFGTNDEKSTQANFYSGYLIRSTPNTSVKSKLSTAVTPFTANEDNTVEYHFYTFGHKPTAPQLPTILTIQSIKTLSDGGNVYTYYPIHLTEAELGTGNHLTPGMKYTITLTLNGDVNNGGGGGTPDPEVPVVNADITVSVTAAAWTAKVVSKEFN